jgi:hypothetical protein
MVFHATGQDPNRGDTLRLQVEVQPLGMPFLNTPTSTGSPAPNASGGVALSATVTNLANGSYHWQARAADQTSHFGPWTAFGSGVSADFIVNIVNPVLTVTPTTIRDSANAGTSPVQVSLQIANTGTGGSIAWSAVKDSAWIGLSASSGSTPATLIDTLNPTSRPAGTYQGTVTVTTSAPGALGTPAKIAVTFVIQQPVLVVTPATVTHSTNVGSASFTDILRIANGGTGPLSWTAAHNLAHNWLALDKTSGGVPDQIQLTTSSSGLAAGTYRDTVVVTAAGASGSPDSIPVTLTVFQPVLVVSPAVVPDSANVGTTASRTTTLHVTNAGNGTLSWTATKTASWVGLSKTSGGAPDSVMVTLSPASLPAGTQRDTIVFSSPEANNSPIKVPVQFNILQPALSVTPATLADSAIQGDTTSRVKTLTVANTGRGNLSWSATRDSAWITLSPSSAPAPSTLTVTLHPGGQPVGTYNGKVVVTSTNATGSPVTIPVTLSIKPPPILSVSPSTYSDSALQGSAPHSFQLHMTNTGPGTLTWTATKDTTWVALSKSAGGAPDSTTVTLTPGGLAAGPHTGSVTVTAPGAAGSPKTVQVNFKITAPPNAPTNLGQFQSDGTTPIPTCPDPNCHTGGLVVTSATVVLAATVTDPDPGALITLNVQVTDGTTTYNNGTTTAVLPGNVAFYRITVPAGGTALTAISYTWKAQACDQSGRCSALVSHGGSPDFLAP